MDKLFRTKIKKKGMNLPALNRGGLCLQACPALAPIGTEFPSSKPRFDFWTIAK